MANNLLSQLVTPQGLVPFMNNTKFSNQRSSGGPMQGGAGGEPGGDGSGQDMTSLMDMFKQFLGGNKSSNEQLSRFKPWQEAIMQQQGMQGAQNFNPDAIEARYNKNFQQNTIPSISERFTAMGGRGGGQRSSAFQAALGGAGADLNSQLAALRSQSGLQQLQLGLQPSHENIYTPKSGGFLEGLAPFLGNVAGTAALGYLAPGVAATKGGTEGAGALFELFKKFMQSQGGY